MGGEGEEEGGLVEGLGDEGFGDGVVLDYRYEDAGDQPYN